MLAATTAMNAGNYLSAIQSANKAYGAAVTEEQFAQVHQKRGIIYRLWGTAAKDSKYFELSFDEFGRAMDNCGEWTLHCGGIRRDLAALHMAHHDHDPTPYASGRTRLDDADYQIELSLQTLQRLCRFGDDLKDVLVDGKIPDEVFEARLEYYATIGFLARLRLKQGRRQDASSLFRRADNGLRARHDTYELNNLTVWLKEFKFMIPLRGVRMLKLIRATGQTRRYRQMIGLG